MYAVSIEDIDKRFKKTNIQEQLLLSLDLRGSSEEEKISAIYRLTHHSSQIQQENDGINLMIRYDRLHESDRVIQHFVDYFTNSYPFKNIAFYGDISELLLAGIFRINRNLTIKIKHFKMKEDALKYVSPKMIQTENKTW